MYVCNSVLDEIIRHCSKNSRLGNHLLRSDDKGGLDQVKHCSQSPFVAYAGEACVDSLKPLHAGKRLIV